jgi:hypothetical protein
MNTTHDERLLQVLQIEREPAICPACNGSGTGLDDSCRSCNGEGMLPRHRVTFDVPSFAEDVLDLLTSLAEQDGPCVDCGIDGASVDRPEDEHAADCRIASLRNRALFLLGRS